ncbi:MAG TPA: hypothetical protein VFV19_10880 [Candidatus Polarisedimenticolaceae bacterium]|nr:hypothetical protein [Candidatus Polarisedimenticolaceae bacterium]
MIERDPEDGRLACSIVIATAIGFGVFLLGLGVVLLGARLHGAPWLYLSAFALQWLGLGIALRRQSVIVKFGGSFVGAAVTTAKLVTWLGAWPR